MAALAAAVLMSMAVAPATAQTPRGDVPIHIEAQPLADALLQLGRQTSLQLYFPPELVAGKRAPAVNGTMRPEAALDSLLKGSGIQYQRSGNQDRHQAQLGGEAGKRRIEISRGVMQSLREYRAEQGRAESKRGLLNRGQRGAARAGLVGGNVRQANPVEAPDHQRIAEADQQAWRGER